MIGRIACTLLLLFAFCGAEESIGVKEDIAAAQTKVKTMSDNSVKTVAAVKETLGETTQYFNSSNEKYQEEGKTITNSAIVALANVTNKYIGDAIDKNRPVTTFKCIVKVNDDTQKQILDGGEATSVCITGVYNRVNSEMKDLRIQLDLIQNATTGLYDVIYSSLESCTTSSCVAQLVHDAEVRENNLMKLVRVYVERGADLRIQYNDGQLACLRSAEQYAENTLKVCANKMKNC